MPTKTKKKKKTKKRRKPSQKQCAVFTYDLFPYMVVHDVLSVDEDGAIEICQGYWRSADSLIAIFPRKRKKEIEELINEMERAYRVVQEDARNNLLYEFGVALPALKKYADSKRSKNAK
jgi:hypothetical protein